VLATLLERNLVTIRGRSKVVGRPLLYGTTPDFLDYFGLRDLSELPRPEELRALVAAREPEQLEISELDAMAAAASGLPAAGAAAAPDETDATVEASRDVGESGVEGEDDEFEDEFGDEEDEAVGDEDEPLDALEADEEEPDGDQEPDAGRATSPGRGRDDS
jgi:segregation and condensation protein B